MSKKIKVASLFSGAGGLDLGFEKAGFHIEWANEYDSKIWETFEKNFPDTKFDRRSIVDVPSKDIPSDIDGIVGGPPCQSWSLAGSMKGIEDKRGGLFYEYIRVLRDLQPKFFLAENVPGIVSSRHIGQFKKIISEFENVGYKVNYKVLNASDFGVPEDRKRVIVIGFRNDLDIDYSFPKPTHGVNGVPKVTQRDAFKDLPDSTPAKQKNKTNGNLEVPNHEHYLGAFSSRFMSRNRRRDWDEQGFTVEASGRHAKLHPSACPMIKLEQDLWKFDEKSEKPYRRLSVRESARIQSFPDDFIFYYKDLNDGYKMVGNAVPVEFARNLALSIKKHL